MRNKIRPKKGLFALTGDKIENQSIDQFFFTIFLNHKSKDKRLKDNMYFAMENQDVHDFIFFIIVFCMIRLLICRLISDC